MSDDCYQHELKKKIIKAHPEMADAYSQWELEDLMLDMTKNCIEAWCAALVVGEMKDQIGEFEKLVIDWSKKEWGADTTVNFHRPTVKVVISSPDGRVFEWRKNVSTYSYDDGPGAA